MQLVSACVPMPCTHVRARARCTLHGRTGPVHAKMKVFDFCACALTLSPASPPVVFFVKRSGPLKNFRFGNDRYYCHKHDDVSLPVSLSVPCLCLCRPVCLSVCLSVPLPFSLFLVSVAVCLSVCTSPSVSLPCLCLCRRLSVCTSPSLSLPCLCRRLSVCRSVPLPVSLFIVSVSVAVCLSVCTSPSPPLPCLCLCRRLSVCIFLSYAARTRTHARTHAHTHTHTHTHLLCAWILFCVLFRPDVTILCFLYLFVALMITMNEFCSVCFCLNQPYRLSGRKTPSYCNCVLFFSFFYRAGSAKSLQELLFLALSVNVW